MPRDKQTHTSMPRYQLRTEILSRLQDQKPPAVTKPGKRIAENVDITNNEQSKKALARQLLTELHQTSQV
eukprot:12979095-Ditylum_brightwellii.AAC.1